MKKICFLLIILLSFTLVGCSNSSNSNSSQSESSSTQSDPDEESMNSEGSDILVAYFCQTGNTQKIAEDISADLDANLFQILPKQPYSQTDLDYNSENSRAEVEYNDDTSRPEIDGTVEDMNKFNYVFIGYPIWFGEAPRIISTFLESYDFSGKTIIPFCTSGSSPIGDSATKLTSLTKNATWMDGMRFSADSTPQEVRDWVNSLDIKE